MWGWWIAIALGAVPVLGPPPDPARDPRGAMLHALLLDMGQDSVTAEPAALAELYRAAGAAGAALACDPAPWHGADGRFDLAAAGAALGPACAAGDPVACLVVGWSLTQDRPGTFSRLPADAERGEAAFRRACDAGLRRGCTELAYLRRQGIGTYRSEARAIAAAAELCDLHDEPEACRAATTDDGDDARLLRAVALGHAAALGDLAERATGAEAVELHRAACDAGVAWACAEAATSDPERASAWYARGCALGDGASCASDQVARVERDASMRPAAIATLSALCPSSPVACREARFLEQGAPAVAARPGAFPRGAKDVDSVLVDLRPSIRACYLGALAARPELQGTPILHLLVGEDGAVWGARVEDGFGPTFEACLEAVAFTARFRAPHGGPVAVAAPVPLSHAASARIRAGGADSGPEIAAVSASAPAWGRAVDACWIEHQRPLGAGSLRLAFNATRAGDVEAIEPLETEDPELVACVAGAIAGVGLDHPPALPTRVEATFTFLEPADPPSGEVIREPARLPTPASTSTWKVLVLVVTAADMEGGKGVLGKGSSASILAAHEGMATFVEEASAGAVRLEHTYRTLPALPLAGALLEDEDGDRFRLSPSDLPSDLVAAIEPLTWDVVYLWVPLPKGSPRPDLGTAWREPVRGAILVTGGIPHREDLRANAPSPAFELPLHEWWHTVQYRAWSELEAPMWDNHEPIRLWDGRVLSPVTWSRSGSTTAVAWYELMLERLVHPDLWADLEAAPRATVPEPERDLALRAGPLEGAPVRSGHLVVDGLLDGPQGLAAVAVEGAERPWFGVRWAEPVSVAEVVAYTGTEGGEPTVTTARAEARVGGAWQDLGPLVAGANGAWTLAFSPRAADAVRVVTEAAGGRRPRVLEIVVRGPE